MAGLVEVNERLKEFQAFVPELTALEISEPWDIASSGGGTSFPNAALPGVYLFLNDVGQVIYVGKGSSGLGQRLGNGYIGRDGKLKEAKVDKASVLLTIGIPWGFGFFSHALEAYLIEKLNPPANKNGRSGDC